MTALRVERAIRNGIELNTPLIGPIQLVVISFPQDVRFRGEILRAFSNIRGHGVIRLIDALFVRKDADGRVTASMRESDLALEEREALGAIVGCGLLGLADRGDAESAGAVAALAAESIADDAFGFGGWRPPEYQGQASGQAARR